MNRVIKFGIGVAVIILAGLTALPFSKAQARVLTDVIQLDAGGAFLGIQMEDVDTGNMSKYKLDNERGAIVRSVVKGSPAEAAGLKEGDVILEFGGTQVWSSMQLSRMVKETPVGRKVDVAISRDGKPVNLSARIERRDRGIAENRREMLPDGFSGPGQRFFQFQSPEKFNPGTGRGPVVATKPRLGISVQPLTEQLGDFMGVPHKKGALVSSVADGSPSAGKLKAGDVIVGCDGKDVDEPETLTQILRNKSQGTIALKVIRDKKEITIAVSLSESDEKGFKL